jgi:hypothetical protein
MFNLIPNEISNTKKIKEFDLPFFSREKKREEILLTELSLNPHYVPKTGLSSINPYKSTFDMILAKNRVELEYYKNSVLWSAKFKPNHFIYLFVIPMAFGTIFTIYSLNYSMEKKMMKFKQKGCIFPQSEKKGVFKIWTQEEYIDEIYGDIFQKNELEVYDKLYRKKTTQEPELLNKNKDYRKMLNYKFQKIAFEKKMTQI